MLIELSPIYLVAVTDSGITAAAAITAGGGDGGDEKNTCKSHFYFSIISD